MYETEEQQVEALKKWWQENGKSIIAGVVIGLIGVFGWRGWIDYRNNVGAQASNLFDQLVVSVEGGDADSVAKQVELLHRDYGSTPYPAFGELMLARVLHAKGDSAGAKASLQRAIDDAPDQALKAVAVLRLARVQLANGELDAVAALLDRYPASTAFAAEYAVVRGDLARARGDADAARGAYQQAIAGQAGNADLVQLKLENLPPAPAPAS